MLANELQAGDVLLATDGNPSDHVIIYEVMNVRTVESSIVAVIKFQADGGLAERTWMRHVEVPHVRPDPVDEAVACRDPETGRLIGGLHGARVTGDKV